MPVATTRKPNRKQDKKRPQKTGRKVLYENYAVRMCVGDASLVAKEAKSILGWTEVDDKAENYDLEDYGGKKIRLLNNFSNRWFMKSIAMGYAQEVLRRRWRFNGESLVIGKTGVTISCQHRLVGLVLAYQMWEADKEKYYQWETEPTMECLLVLGVSEDDEVVNTIDTGRPRSLADVVYRSPYYRDLKANDKKAVSRMTDVAVRTLWARAVPDTDEFAIKRTHSESIEFIEKHSKLLECVRTIWEEDEERKLGKYLSPGVVCALLYLMSCSKSNLSKYQKVRDEVCLDWSLFDKAKEFFTLLIAGRKFQGVNKALGGMIRDDVDHQSARMALIIKAWDLFLNGKPMGEASLSLEYHTDEDGVRHLMEHPVVGGIDLGDGEEVIEPEEIPQPEEVEKAKKSVKSESLSKTKKAKGKKPVRKTKPKSDGPIKYGDKVWVTKKGEATWSGIVKSVGEKTAQVSVGVGHKGAGSIYSVPITNITKEAPTSD